MLVLQYNITQGNLSIYRYELWILSKLLSPQGLMAFNYHSKGRNRSSVFNLRSIVIDFVSFVDPWIQASISLPSSMFLKVLKNLAGTKRKTSLPQRIESRFVHLWIAALINGSAVHQCIALRAKICISVEITAS